ncbi:MAG: U32 family peptidase [Oscillospiraceae bacterium]
MRNKPEILAPAGDFNSIVAAVRSGADAVYFGTETFNARQNATNFKWDEFSKAVEFCHLHNVKCYITLNTLVKDDELVNLKETVKRICNASADALILQDLAAARLAYEICPDIEMHASTQMTVGTLDGLFELKELGFKRAVLPRELSKSEIKYLCKNSPIELEVFVHGALCMCVSGQCLMSAMLGSRSGNRGLCAQPCRLPFRVENGTGADLSLKDNSLISNIKEMYDMGVNSFKIEGRMKRPEYVSASVIASREALEDKYENEREEELKALFSRSGFTKGYYEGKLSRDMFGIREKENVTSATSALLKKYAKEYEKEKEIYPVEFVFTAKNSEKISLSASASGFNVFALSDEIAQTAVNRPLTSEIIELQLKKCGGTVFTFACASYDIDDNLSVPMSAINALRREALSLLEERIKSRKAPNCSDAEIKINQYEAKKLNTYLCFNYENEIPEDIKADDIFIPLFADAKLVEKLNAGVIIPRGIFGNEEKFLKQLKKTNAKKAICNTLDAVAIAKKAGVEIIGGPSLNIFNSLAIDEIEKIGAKEIILSYEMTLNKIRNLGGNIKRGVVAYGKVPLMLTRNCPIRNGKNCNECNKKGVLTDRMGIKFPIICNNGFSEILNSRPIYMADRLNEIKNTDFIVLNFTNETKSEILEIISDYQNKIKPNCEFTRGLLYRGVE